MARIARIFVAFGLALAVAACDSGLNLNPMSWFGDSRSEPTLVALEPAGGWPAEADRRPLVTDVTALRIERTTTGAIVHATGLPPRLGHWDVELVAVNDGEPENGVLSYMFKVAPPRGATAASTPYARRLEAAAFIPNAKLAKVRAIRVVGERNSRTARR